MADERSFRQQNEIPSLTPSERLLWNEQFPVIWNRLVPYYENGRPFDLQHVQWMLEKGREVCTAEELNEMLLLTAIAGHDVGYSGMDNLQNYRSADVKIEHMKRGVAIMKEILEDVQFPNEYIERVLYLIGNHDNWALDKYEEYKKDHYLAVLGDIDFLYVLSKEGFENVRQNRSLLAGREIFSGELLESFKNDKKHELMPWATKTTERMFQDLIQEREADYTDLSSEGV